VTVICRRIRLFESAAPGGSVVWVVRISAAWKGVSIVRGAPDTRRGTVPITGVAVVVFSAGGTLAIVMATRGSVTSGTTTLIVRWRSRTTTRRGRGAGAATLTRALFLSVSNTGDAGILELGVVELLYRGSQVCRCLKLDKSFPIAIASNL